MITLTFQLVFQNRAKMTHQEVTNYIIEHFPLILRNDRKEGMVISADGPTEEGEVILKLNQDTLTEDQEMWQTTDEIARQYISMCKVTPDKIKPVTPTLEPWQAETVHDILANTVNKVPSNGKHTRFYTEPLAERQWDNEHHLIDIEGKEPMYSSLTITQCSTSEPARAVKLHYNEVDELLTALLQWRMDAARASHETTTKVDDDSLSDLDDGPIF